MKKGFTLIEILVALALFAILSVLVTQTLVNNLRSSKKSDSTAKVRTEVDFALSTMERLLRNAERIDDPDGGPAPVIPLAQRRTCKLDTYYQLQYYDRNQAVGSFYCVPASGTNPGYIASGSANIANRITSEEISVTCDSTTFQCTFDDNYQHPSSVTVKLIAKSSQDNAADATHVTSSTTVIFRSY